MKNVVKWSLWLHLPVIGLTPIILLSCNSNQTSPTNPNLQEPKPDGANFIDPIKYPQFFNDAHILSLDKLLNARNTSQILQNTSQFQYSLSNLKWLLKNYQNGSQTGIDFINNSSEQVIKTFYQALENIGIYGDYQFDDPLELVKFSPRIFLNKYLTTPKHLQSDLKNFKNPNQKILLKAIDLNPIVQANVFGFLPSNLSQLFYYADFASIAKLFQISDLINIAAQFDDQQGTIKFFFEDKFNQTYQMNYDQNNLSSLKRTYDFKQFIFDRSFNIQARFWQYEDRSPFLKKGYKFSQKTLSGTAWVLDRIVNPALEKQGQYEFLVGTNMHVANLIPYFSKNHLISDSFYNQNWNGGFADPLGDKITTETHNDRQYDILKKTNKLISFQFAYYEERNNEKVENNTSDQDLCKWTNSITLNSNNYLDLVWYTPKFVSDNVFSSSAGNNEYFFGENQQFGNLFNGGVDFAILKVILTSDQVQKLFPNLFSLLGQENEKFWYVGLGTDQLVSPSDTFFIGGFPEWKWRTLESVGGRINTKMRYIDKDLTSGYWKKYQKEENELMNQFNFRKNWYTQPQRNDMQHGMAVEHVLQNSVLNIKSKNDQYLKGGASGSMVINSRFEAVGIIYNLVLPPGSINPDDVISNSVALFKHHSQFNNWSGSILQDVQAKLQTENLQTIKLNPIT